VIGIPRRAHSRAFSPSRDRVSRADKAKS
jgi:hypothetical protein